MGHTVSNVAVISPDGSVLTFTVEYSMLENAPADPTAWTTHSDTFTVNKSNSVLYAHTATQCSCVYD